MNLHSSVHVGLSFEMVNAIDARVKQSCRDPKLTFQVNPRHKLQNPEEFVDFSRFNIRDAINRLIQDTVRL